VTQWLCVGSVCVIDSTPSMNDGKLSNCVHWSYATRTGTSTSIDSSILLIRLPLLRSYQSRDANRIPTTNDPEPSTRSQPKTPELAQRPRRGGGEGAAGFTCGDTMTP